MPQRIVGQSVARVDARDKVTGEALFPGDFSMPGMLHAKLVAVDEAVALVGSANVDMRSLYLNYELAAVLLGETEVAQVAACIDSYARQGRRQQVGSPELRPWGSELLEDVLQTLSPLLFDAPSIFSATQSLFEK